MNDFIVGLKNMKTTIFGTITAICMALAPIFPQYAGQIAAIGALAHTLKSVYTADAK